MCPAKAGVFKEETRPAGAHRQLFRSALSTFFNLSRPKKIYKTNPFSYLQKGALSFSTLSHHSAKPAAHCRLPTIFTQHSALSTQHSALSTSAPSTQHYALRLPTADCPLSSLSTQNSALSTSFFGCQLPTIHLPSLKNQPYKKVI